MGIKCPGKEVVRVFGNYGPIALSRQVGGGLSF